MCPTTYSYDDTYNNDNNNNNGKGGGSTYPSDNNNNNGNGNNGGISGDENGQQVSLIPPRQRTLSTFLEPLLILTIHIAIPYYTYPTRSFASLNHYSY